MKLSFIVQLYFDLIRGIDWAWDQDPLSYTRHLPTPAKRHVMWHSTRADWRYCCGGGASMRDITTTTTAASLVQMAPRIALLLLCITTKTVLSSGSEQREF